MNAAAIRAALEALEVGDQELAAAVLLDLLEEPSGLGQPKSQTPCSEPGCGYRGWPGQVDAHMQRCHTAPVLAPAPPPRRMLRLIPGGRR